MKIARWLLIVFILTGCRSHVIKVTVINGSSEKISNVVIDYPGATFGISSLAPGKNFQYNIKPNDAGALKIQFANAHGSDRTSTGPVVHRNDEGSVEIRLTQDGATSVAKIVAAQ
ncbi:MAG: hypothetical protein DMG65_13045 [Candidatus Angelobacter sp. Gp1-AA117]|nr:MAG: hypothetical protein DMG65_13045 [Candidatus Angelobacter sp. Gp1-AA117]